MQVFLDMVGRSRLLAPNLKERTLTLYTGRTHKGNEVARAVVRDHLAALRWMNPNAVIYLREASGQGTPTVSYSLCASPPRRRARPARTLFPRRPRARSPLHQPCTHTHTHTLDCARAGVQPGGAVPPKVMEITPSVTPEEVVAKIMMASRDPDLEATGGVAPSEHAQAAAGAAPAAAPRSAPAAAPAAPPPSPASTAQQAQQLA